MRDRTRLFLLDLTTMCSWRTVKYLLSCEGELPPSLPSGVVSLSLTRACRSVIRCLKVDIRVAAYIYHLAAYINITRQSFLLSRFFPAQNATVHTRILPPQSSTNSLPPPRMDSLQLRERTKQGRSQTFGQGVQDFFRAPPVKFVHPLNFFLAPPVIFFLQPNLFLWHPT